MNDEKKEQRKLNRARWERERIARLSPAERQRKSKADNDRYHAQSPEQRLRTRALQRKTWAKRKKAKLTAEQREREDERRATLAPEQQEAEDALLFELYERSMNAIDDLGTDDPDYSASDEWSYCRDPKVRKAVVKRAKGKCEFCGKLGFVGRDGKRYLETHHVIFLANEWADKPTNVIALCPNDHR